MYIIDSMAVELGKYVYNSGAAAVLQSNLHIKLSAIMIKIVKIDNKEEKLMWSKKKKLLKKCWLCVVITKLSGSV